MKTDEEIKKEYNKKFCDYYYPCESNGDGIIKKETSSRDISDFWLSKLHTLQEEYKKELIEKIEKIGVDLGEGRVLDIAWSDLKQNIITIINNSN